MYFTYFLLWHPFLPWEISLCNFSHEKLQRISKDFLCISSQTKQTIIISYFTLPYSVLVIAIYTILNTGDWQVILSFKGVQLSEWYFIIVSHWTASSKIEKSFLMYSYKTINLFLRIYRYYWFLEAAFTKQLKTFHFINDLKTTFSYQLVSF